MSSYIDHHAPLPAPGVGTLRAVLIHSWEADARQRLAWLYGDPEARIAANAPDLARWNALGRRVAA